MIRMLVVIFLAMLAISSAAYVFLGELPPTHSATALEVFPAEVSVGTLPFGAEESFETSITNRSKRVLEITQVRSSCGCTELKVEARCLSPGQTTIVSGRVRAKGNEGPFQHDVLISTGPPNLDRVRFSVVGEVKRRVTFLPTNVVLRPDMVTGTADLQLISIRNGTQHSIKLRQVGVLPRGVLLAQREYRVGPNSATEVQLEVDANVVVPSEFELRMTCSDPMERSIRIPIVIKPISSVTIEPAAIHFGVLSRADLATVQEVIVNVRGDLLASSDVEEVIAPSWLSSDSDFGSVMEDGDRRFVFVLSPELANTGLDGEILIMFRHRPSGSSFGVGTELSGFLLNPIGTGGEKP